MLTKLIFTGDFVGKNIDFADISQNLAQIWQQTPSMDVITSQADRKLTDLLTDFIFEQVFVSKTAYTA